MKNPLGQLFVMELVHGHPYGHPRYFSRRVPVGERCEQAGLSISLHHECIRNALTVRKIQNGVINIS